MSLPLLPLGIGLTSATAGAALSYWLSNDKADPWEDKKVFNARMRDMHSLALALNSGFATCDAFRKDAGQLQAWRGARDNFGKFYSDVGTLVYSSPSAAQVAQAKSYASIFFFWSQEYDKFKCGRKLPGLKEKKDPYSAIPDADPNAASNKPQDWAAIAKWGGIGIGILVVGSLIRSSIRDMRA